MSDPLPSILCESLAERKFNFSKGDTNIAKIAACRFNRDMNKPSGPHDLGGLEAGPVDRNEKDTAYWEWQIDAMIRLALSKGLLSDFAELRDGIEHLDSDDYERFTYYERWAKSLAYTLLSKGVIAEEALASKISEIKDRQSADGIR
jgi:hypothetical protein